jgi:glycolate dehydrogenase FAD-binding subunit
MASLTDSSRLSGISGSSSVITDPVELAAYQIGGRIPAVVVRPRASEEVAEIVKFAGAERLAIVPTGARTKFSMGMPPRQYDLALDMTQLDRLIAYDPGDLTLGVEAGTPLQKIAGVLAEHRQFLPLSVPFLSLATIGGTIASGVDTPLRQYYGTARDYLLGTEFVTGEGLLAKSGGRVVKNVTGYDIHKLMVGALGTLGVITKINFRTFPLPGATRAFVALFETAKSALELRHLVARSPLTPLTIEILSPRAAELFSGHVATQIEPAPIPRNLFSPSHWAFTTSFAGNQQMLERYERDLLQMAEQSGAIRAAVLAETDLTGALGRTREFIPIALASSEATTIVKVVLLPSRVSESLEDMARAAETNSLCWAALVRGLGVIYLALLPSDGEENTLGRVQKATDQVLAETSALGGNATIPWCPGKWKSGLRVWGLERGDLEQTRRLKHVFDPRGVLSPGRFVGGL